MTAPELPHAPEADAVGAPVEQPVRPRAWAIFVDNGNARMWSTLQPHVQKLADAEGLTITPLYDQAALDAAVTAERERWRTAAECAAHQLEKARIWGGMEWHYNPLHPMHYRSALERLRDVLRA